jgi:hypothetical protein
MGARARRGIRKGRRIDEVLVLPSSPSVYDEFLATWRYASDWHKNHSYSHRRTNRPSDCCDFAVSLA